MFETRLTALHIDVARFASDDFNPFHDRHKWQRIAGNPFGGPIALGFQLGACGLEAVRDARRAAVRARRVPGAAKHPSPFMCKSRLFRPCCLRARSRASKKSNE